MGTKTVRINAIDVFCGVGGLTKGLGNAGVNVVAGIDVDPDCKYPLTKNNTAQFFLKDVADLDSGFVSDLIPDSGFTLVAGCAPCQPFSRYGRGAQRRRGKWSLLLKFGEIVCDVLPDFVSMENVPEVTHHDAFTEFESQLRSVGYSVSSGVLYCPDYGVPQQRRRLVLLASKHGTISLPTPTRTANNYKTVRQAIGDLPPIAAGEASADDELHRACNLSDINKQRIRASVAGGSWRDWPPSLRSACHQAESGETYPSVYGRMKWELPAPTITTQFFGYGNGRFGHPEQDRAISIREGALLQSFPKGYKFHSSKEHISAQRLGRLIGNAVPVKLAEAVGRAIIRHAKQVVRNV